MKKILSLFIMIILTSSCSTATTYISELRNDVLEKTEDVGTQIIDVADIYVGMHEKTNRQTLKEFVGVDPVITEWCSAFVNSVLNELGLPGSEIVSEYPLMARSFMGWGEEVIGKPKAGDVIVFPRGGNNWQGHVGFFVVSFKENGKEYYIILGGNQNNEVSYETYESKRAIAIRRWPS